MCGQGRLDAVGADATDGHPLAEAGLVEQVGALKLRHRRLGCSARAWEGARRDGGCAALEWLRWWV